MKKIYYLILLFLIVGGCSKDDESKNPIELEPETLVAEENEIVSVSENTIILTGGNTDLEINDIIVSGANANAPRGFLRKIKNVGVADGNIVLTTERATIEEGLRYFKTTEDTLRASFSHTFTQSDEQGRGLSKNDLTILLEIDKTLLVNGDQLNLNGTLEISPTLDLEIIVGYNSVKLSII